MYGSGQETMLVILLCFELVQKQAIVQYETIWATSDETYCKI